jgi:hypothetical protein
MPLHRRAGATLPIAHLGPLLDRLDMHVEVPRVPASALQDVDASGETTQVVAARVLKSRAVQWQRQGKCNARLSASEVERFCAAEPGALALLQRAMHKFSLSARAYHRILKVARSIADLHDVADHGAHGRGNCFAQAGSQRRGLNSTVWKEKGPAACSGRAFDFLIDSTISTY